MEYAILAGIGISIVTSALKWLTLRFGGEWAKFIVVTFVFVASLVVAAFQHFAPGPVWQETVLIFSTATAWYSVVHKMIIVPVLEKAEGLV